MEHRDRRVAQIVRDFMQAYVLALEVADRLAANSLDFAEVDRLVGESEESLLHLLKEECHALFRFDGSRTATELEADQLFDLAIGALFHEGMKFREGYYLTMAYGPRLERMMAEGSASGPLVDSFVGFFEAGRRRMHEAHSETVDLFRETRDQLVILLCQLTHSGAIARSLVEDPDLTRRVFGVEVGELLDRVYGSSLAGYRLAVSHLVRNGHYEETVKLIDRSDMRQIHYCEIARHFSEGMAGFYAGDSERSVERLGEWIELGAVGDVQGDAFWRERASRVLESIADDASRGEAVSAKARRLLEAIRPLPA